VPAGHAWSLASYSRSMRLMPLIVGVVTRKTLRQWAKVSDRAAFTSEKVADERVYRIV
jgi:hypothetical protein